MWGYYVCVGMLRGGRIAGIRVSISTRFLSLGPLSKALMEVRQWRLRHGEVGADVEDLAPEQ